MPDGRKFFENFKREKAAFFAAFSRVACVRIRGKGDR
jgi:hypothetical protein